MPADTVLHISAEKMQQTFCDILLRYGFTADKATACAAIFTANSIDGIYTHGVNRFAKFIQYIKAGNIDVAAAPVLQNSFGGMEQWNGNFGPGPLNALDATDRAMQLAAANGIGCVALANTNHWHRGGTYGWRAAKKGFAFICWTNTIANMPAWGAKDARLGNNPLVFALPYGDEAIVLDMAMSQYSFGAMELAVMNDTKLAVTGGYDKDGALTNNPAEILHSRRPLPIGYWKGAGLSLLLDLLASILSGGLSTHQSTAKGIEFCSQVFIAIDISKLGNASAVGNIIQNIIDNYKQSVPVTEQTAITYPGERILATRKINTEKGIPVFNKVWEEIVAL